MALQDFIKKRLHLVWYTKNVATLSEAAIVEGVLQYGDFSDVKKLFRILGIDRVARIFRRQIRQSRVNYDPRIVNYFSLYFRRYAKK